MHDSRDLDAKKGPPWQDSRAMYPKSPDCTPKRIHGTKILPASARKAYISRKRCQGGPLFSCNQRKEDTWRANLATAAKATSKIDTTNQ